MSPQRDTWYLSWTPDTSGSFVRSMEPAMSVDWARSVRSASPVEAAAIDKVLSDFDTSDVLRLLAYRRACEHGVFSESLGNAYDTYASHGVFSPRMLRINAQSESEASGRDAFSANVEWPAHISDHPFGTF